MCSPQDLLGLRVPTRLSRILEQWTDGTKRLRQNCRQNLLKKRCWGPGSSNETQACFEKKFEEARKRTGTNHCWPHKNITNILLSYCYKESHPQLAWVLRFEEFWTPQTKTNSQVKRVKIGRLDKEKSFLISEPTERSNQRISHSKINCKHLLMSSSKPSMVSNTWAKFRIESLNLNV